MGRTHCTLNPQGLLHPRLVSLTDFDSASPLAFGLFRESLSLSCTNRRPFSVVLHLSIEGVNSSSLVDMRTGTETGEEVNEGRGRGGLTAMRDALLTDRIRLDGRRRCRGFGHHVFCAEIFKTEGVRCFGGSFVHLFMYVGATLYLYRRQEVSPAGFGLIEARFTADIR